ncbi:hypothetical protein COCSUDRAFT_43470 [Coccomyxa subellipsoidea C-169]|uniref:Protein kinase domain-containing protein n=1 Tax=Coccomyxa subellipsoidea (strain C-169) TaxID=574566 RepID=I0YRV5_COCSC|nr:hypothetical protein COCSUDRAFT_43470 [Coccomyxa subellipsoidea C-169]EIE21124.1 hypothetical protein COCSUDRAFT_43470 [Coccomyxa subellipsoidea C-169]|eukprot:XP_005645668.1 hypothetical protein COCSUDRAFT_43470 [Coccomyxa subellipsoidea C-169]
MVFSQYLQTLWRLISTGGLDQSCSQGSLRSTGDDRCTKIEAPQLTGSAGSHLEGAGMGAKILLLEWQLKEKDEEAAKWRAQAKMLEMNLEAADDDYNDLEGSLKIQTDKIQAMRVCYDALQGSSNAKQARIQELEATVSQREFVNRWQQDELGRIKRRLTEKESIANARRLPRAPQGAKFRVNRNEFTGGGQGCISAVTMTVRLAAKVPHPDAESRAEVAREEAALAAIPPHENIIAAVAWASNSQVGIEEYDVESVEPAFRERDALLLELADHDLGREIWSSRQTSQPTIEKRRALDIACQLTRGLRHIHEAGYIHGDIKEGNLLCFGDTLKIADFGCARRLSDVNDWEGSHIFLTPAVSMRAAKQGKADEMRATCVVIHNLISRRNAVAVLDDQYEGLSGDDKARVDAQCRAVYSEEQLERCSDGQIMDQGLRLAAAEHLELIGIDEIVLVVEGLPQELLAAVLQGINRPSTLCLDTLYKMLAAALDDARWERPASPSTDGWSFAGWEANKASGDQRGNSADEDSSSDDEDISSSDEDSSSADDGDSSSADDEDSSSDDEDDDVTDGDSCRGSWSEDVDSVPSGAGSHSKGGSCSHEDSSCGDSDECCSLASYAVTLCYEAALGSCEEGSGTEEEAGSSDAQASSDAEFAFLMALLLQGP